jgi:molybdate transport system permease protein
MDLAPLWLTVRIALGAMVIVIPLGIVTAWWLVHGRRFRGKVLLETLFTLPLVLPPTVVGFALLMVLGRGTSFGRWLNDTGVELLFTWQGAVIAAAVMAFPLFMRSAAAAFAAIDKDLLDMARIYGASDAKALASVVVPMSYRGLAAGTLLACARAVGEFGATLMVAGSIPGRTRTLSLALYSSVEAGHDDQALVYAILLVLITIGLVASVRAWEGVLSARRG